jgi:hypothetical protein
MDERAMTIYLMRAVRLAVASGALKPSEALTAVVTVAGSMVGEVRDPVRRGQWEDHVMRTFPLAVSCASKNQHREMLQ